MTCIAGIKHQGKVYIGCDSAGVGGWEITSRKDPKIFISGKFAFGCTTSFRMIQLLRYRLKIPSLPVSDGQIHRYLSTDFVDAVRQCLKDGGMAEKEKDVEKGGTFMIGVHGRLFVIHDDYQVSESLDSYASIGSGAAYALGSLATSIGNPIKRIKKALEVAAYFNMGVRGPFDIIKAPDAQKTLQVT